MAQINNELNVYDRIPISYGLLLRMQETNAANLRYRTKLGVDVYIDSVFIGSSEIDIDTTNEYTLELGTVIKTYIKKGLPEFDSFFTAVSDSTRLVTLEPYVLYKDKGEPWAAKQYGTAKSFYAQRGVHRDYYRGIDTPKLPSNDFLVVNDITIPADHKRNLYYAIEGVDDTHNVKITANYFEYDVDGNLVNSSNDIIEVSDGNISHIDIPILRTHPDAVKKAVELVKQQTLKSNGAVVVTEGTLFWNVKYICSPTIDYSVDLVFLDNDFMWKSLPFRTKNQNTFSRESTIVERYDTTREEWNLKVRRSMKLKSDYLTPEQAESIRLVGATVEAYVRFVETDTLHKVIVKNTSLPIPSSKNQGLVQLEIDIEIAKEILTV